MATRIKASQIKEDTLEDNNGDTKVSVEKNPNEDKIRFDSAGSERMIVDNSGRVGIGTDNPQRTLHVETSEDTVAKFHSTDDKAVIRLSDSDSESFLITKDNKFHLGNTSADLDVFTIDWGNSRIGIGTASPTTDLDVDGSIKASGSILGSQRHFTTHKYTATSSSDQLFVRFNSFRHILQSKH